MPESILCGTIRTIRENTAGVHVDYEADTLEKIGEMLS